MGKTVTIFGHQVPVVALVGVAGLLGVILVMRARNRGSNVVSAGTTAAAAAAAQSASAATTYDPNLQGLVSGGSPFAGTPDYGSQLAYIQSQLAALANPSASTTPTSTPTYSPQVGSFMGGSYNPPSGTSYVTDAAGQTWFANSSMDSVLAQMAAGVKATYEPAPGVFVPFTPGVKGYAGGTIYTAVPYPHPPAGAAATTQVAAHA